MSRRRLSFFSWGLAVAAAAAAAGLAETPPLPVFGKGGWIAPAPDPALPSVLILGDSISIGYTREVRHLLRGQANVARPVQTTGEDAPVNCRATTQGLEDLDKWLQGSAGKWDVIHFNFGLHDVAHRNPESKSAGQLDKVHGKISVTRALYEQHLDEIARRLNGTGACLIWASTTIVPPAEPGRYEGDERMYNEIAARVMRKHSIAINDLHAVTASFAAGLFVAPGNVHFKPEANWILARQVVAAIKRHCGKAARRP